MTPLNDSLSHRFVLCWRNTLCGLVFVGGLALALPVEGHLQTKPEAETPTTAVRIQKDVSLLRLGSPRKREMAGGQTHSYNFKLTAGQYVHIVVEQHGIDVVVALFSPDGKPTVEVDSLNGIEGPELLWAVAQSSGEFRLDIHSSDPNVKPGRYEVRIEEIRTATGQDQNRAAGEQALQKAVGLLAKGDEQSLRAALANDKEALKLCGEPPDDRCVADALDSIAGIHYALAEGSEALQRFEEVLPFYERLKDRQGEANTLNNIGHFYDLKSEPEKALRHFHRALEISRSLGTEEGRLVMGAVLTNIGALYARLDRVDQALDKYNEALPIFQKLSQRSPEATLRNNIGQLYLGQGKPREALIQFEVAESMYPKEQDTLDKAILLNNIGSAHFLLKDYPQALNYYNRALLIFQAKHDAPSEAATWTNIGQATGATDSEKAIECYERALHIEGIERGGEIAARGNLGTLYESINRPQAALEEYQKGIALLEDYRASVSLGEIKASLSESLAPFIFKASYLLVRSGNSTQAFDLTELARARTLLDQLGNVRLNPIRATDPQLIKDQEDLEATLNTLEMQLDDPTNQRRPFLEIEYAAAQRRYEDLLLRLNLGSPELASSRRVKTLKVAEVQRQLDSDTTLLSYFVLPDETLAFLITRDSFRAVELTVKEADLYDQIASLRLFPNLRNSEPTTEPLQLQKLYDSLIGPIKQYIHTPKLAIIPHRELHYLSFAMLNDGREYLGDTHTLYYLPSASALPFIQKDKPVGTQMLALAQSTIGWLRQLRFADQQAETIARLFHTQALTKDKASRSEFLKRAEQSSMIHIVAHAETDSASPLFYRIRLGAGKGDIGALEVRQIYNLNLAKASLVVLAACETNLGEHNLREDIVTLGRAFTSAGASTVIASLWRVDDRATAILMTSFYTHLKQGMSKAEALREAQRETRIQYPRPYYWAAFILMGDPGTSKGKPEAAIKKDYSSRLPMIGPTF